MKRLFYILATVFFLTGCDCTQRAKGVVLDKDTKQPIDSVAVNKFDKADLNQPDWAREYTNSLGQFNYRSISGGAFKCPDLELSFSKEAYKSIQLTFESYSQNDTVYLDRVK